MMNVRKSKDRGFAEHGWLRSYHTFSFADYYDPNFMGFKTLRVINEDWIQGGMGFQTHPHRDMEIITYVIDGALEHKDTLGNSTVIRPGEVQRMSAGSGISHSEFNHFKDKETHLLQIWIQTEKKGVAPSYDQKSFLPRIKANELTLVASRDGKDDSVVVYQDMRMYVGNLEAEKTLTFEILKKRGVWLQVVKGSLTAVDQKLSAGDALSIENESLLNLQGVEPAEFILFDLA